MNLTDYKTFAEAAQATVTSLALVIGGIWALRRYVFQKEGFPRIEFFVDAEFIGVHQNEWVVEIVGLLKNLGDVPHEVGRLEFSVRAISDSDPIEDGSDIRGQLVFPQSVKKHAWTPDDTKAPMIKQVRNRKAARCGRLWWARPAAPDVVRIVADYPEYQKAIFGSGTNAKVAHIGRLVTRTFA